MCYWITCIWNRLQNRGRSGKHTGGGGGVHIAHNSRRAEERSRACNFPPSSTNHLFKPVRREGGARETNDRPPGLIKNSRNVRDLFRERIFDCGPATGGRCVYVQLRHSLPTLSRDQNGPSSSFLPTCLSADRVPYNPGRPLPATTISTMTFLQRISL